MKQAIGRQEQDRRSENRYLRCDKIWSEMVRTLILAVALATLAAPAAARDGSFAFEGIYAGVPVNLGDLSADECAAILAKPVVKLSDKLMVAASDIANKRCIGSQEPDLVWRFVGFDQPVKFYYPDHIQVGDGPKFAVSGKGAPWTWEDDKAFYSLVDNLSVIDKVTGKSQCYQGPGPQKQFSCAVNPAPTTAKKASLPVAIDNFLKSLK